MSYEKTTRHIKVQVKSLYLVEQSDPDQGRYVWAYQVRIENQGQETVCLKHRYWHITDARGKVEEVRGPGVVGEQPVLEPGQTFEYTSGCPLATPSGIMHGSYQMETRDGTIFDVAIPAFSLDSPWQPMRLN